MLCIKNWIPFGFQCISALHTVLHVNALKLVALESLFMALELHMPTQLHEIVINFTNHHLSI